MKYILIILIALSTQGKAQNIDTVFVNNLTLQAQDWATLVGSYELTRDSVSMYGYRRIRNKVQSLLPINSWTMNITIDSLPGTTVVELYRIVKELPAGEISTRYGPITSAIAAKINISYWVGYFDAAGVSGFTRRRDKGKNLLID